MKATSRNKPDRGKGSDSIRILVLDDEESIRWVIGKTIAGPEYELHFAESAEAAATVLRQQPIDFALVDVNLPGRDGLSFLQAQREANPGLLMAVITGQGSMDVAVNAMKLGAFDYLTKPFDIDEIEELVARATQTIRNARDHGAGGALAIERAWEASKDLIIGRSRPIREVHKAIGRVAGSELTVLILGESGTGKELIARAIHQHSPQAREPFVAVNCAAIPRDLLEAELFGHEKGAFTGAVERKPGQMEIAGAGTLFLDEIGDMSLALQAKLLRVLQEREFQRVGGLQALPLKARVIAATNQTLESAVSEGRFRHDLLYRINGFSIHSAPLREMREDIPLLCAHFMGRHGETLGAVPHSLTPEALDRLGAHDWPGNVRELENAIKALLITVRAPVIDVDDLPRNIAGGAGTANLDEVFEQSVLNTWRPVVRTYCAETRTGLLHRAGERLERPLIRQVLLETGWNQVRAAQVLGINRNTLRTKMRSLGIRKPPAGSRGGKGKSR